MSLRICSLRVSWTNGRKAILLRAARRRRGRANHSGALHMPPVSERVSWFMVSAFKAIGPLDSESRRLCLREACLSCFGISPLSSSSREHARPLDSERGINGRGPIAAFSQLGGHPFMPRKSEASGLCSKKGRRAQRATDALRLTRRCRAASALSAQRSIRSFCCCWCLAMPRALIAALSPSWPVCAGKRRAPHGPPRGTGGARSAP